MLEVRSTPGDIEDKAIEAVADNWRAVGLTVETLGVPVQRQTDVEWRATRPGFELTRRNTRLFDLNSYHSRETPRPESRYIGRNTPRYVNPELDSLIDQYYLTVPFDERIEIVGQILCIMSDQLSIMGLFYDTEPAFIANRLVNVRAKPPGSTSTWNVQAWDLR